MKRKSEAFAQAETAKDVQAGSQDWYLRAYMRFSISERRRGWREETEDEVFMFQKAARSRKTQNRPA